jgi:hypothetical protein
MTRRRSGRRSAKLARPREQSADARQKRRRNKFDARQAALDADLAEDYAYDAIAFALSAIDEAESETLSAICASQRRRAASLIAFVRPHAGDYHD